MTGINLMQIKGTGVIFVSNQNNQSLNTRLPKHTIDHLALLHYKYVNSPPKK